MQKELLDAEMELFSKQQDGEDTTEHQQKVDGLRAEAAKMGIRGRGGFRGGRGRGFPTVSPRGSSFRGRGRGRGRGFTISPGSNILDRRPTSVLVSGYELEEKNEIIKHFTDIGDIVDTAEDEVSRVLRYSIYEMIFG